MTNFEKWRHYMEWVISPDCYIDFSYYSMICMALQRRVWGGPAHKALYPNIYTILVGDPSVGKGLPIIEVTDILKFHKLERTQRVNQLDPNIKKLDASDQKAAETIHNEGVREEEKTEEEFTKRIKIASEPPLIIPIAPDSTTYQSLVHRMSKSIRRKSVYATRPDGTQYLDIYTHTSLAFLLEEISSLFRKNMNELINFLIKSYDSGDYTYETISREQDRIRRCCLNMLGGTTPGFMQYCFDDQLISDGFSSRTFFIFANKNRKRMIRLPELTTSQIEAREDIIKHVGLLATLYGHVKYTDEAWEFLETWWQKAEHERPNISIKLNPYYGRKNIHIQKLAMALHFSESTEMLIGVDTFKKALHILGPEEKKMHYALGFSKNNPLAGPADKVLKFICRNGSRFTFEELLAELSLDMPSRDMQNDMEIVLRLLEARGDIMTIKAEDPRTKQDRLYYIARTESML